MSDLQRILAFAWPYGPIGCLIAAWILYEWSARALPPCIDPICGKCGYIVKNLPTHICPECGADLRTMRLDVAPRYRTPTAWNEEVIALLKWVGIGWLIAGYFL